jgi:predicted DNA-binding WGR domain protein
MRLYRIDPGRNMARFYELAVERDLFGKVVVVRAWGRIGRPGSIRLDEHPDEAQAQAAATNLGAAKMRRGYRAPE